MASIAYPPKVLARAYRPAPPSANTRLSFLFRRGIVWTRLETDAAGMALAGELTSFRPKGYQFMPAFRNRAWDGHVRYLRGTRLLTGMALHLEALLRARGYAVSVDEDFVVDRPVLALEDLKLAGVTLWPEQIDLIRAALDGRRGMIAAPTAGGKTEVACGIIRCIGARSLFLVARKDLVVQAAERITERLGVSPCVALEGEVSLDSRIMVATVQTLLPAARESREVARWLEGVRLWLLDEAHHGKADSYAALGLFLKSAYRRIGLSAAPLSFDSATNARIMAVFGPVIGEVSAEEQLDAGRIARAHVFLREVGGNERPEELPGHFSTIRESCTCTLEHLGHVRDDVAFLREHKVPFLILVDRIAHGQAVSVLLGLQFIHGKTPLRERTSVLNGLRAGRIPGLVASVILDEGVDVPNLGAVILLAEGRSHIRLIQRMGRGMRRKADSNTVYVVDFINNLEKRLLKHSIARLATYKTMGVVLHEVGEPLCLL